MLQQCLTGELPYALDESRIVEAIQTICEEEPVRLRKARRDAPADLETILLKALAKEPARRYADAGELAADLRRFLAEQPVAARAPTAFYQARKFVRRNRALTVSTAAVILALVVTVGALLVSRRNDRLQFERTRSMLDLTAREVFRLVPELGFGQDHRGTLEALDARLAEELAHEPRDAALRGWRARSLYELGALDQVAGDLARAQRRFEEARTLREGLARERPSDLESRTHLSQIYAHLGELAHLGADPTGELAWFQRAFDLDQQLVRAHPGDAELVEDLGWSLERMTALALRREDWAEAERYARWRLADATRLVERAPDDWKFLNNAAQAHILASAVAARLAPHEVEGHQRALFQFARRLHELQPRRASVQYLWATANHLLAREIWSAGRLQEALPYAEGALGLALQLLAGDPRSWPYVDFLRFTSQTLLQLQRELDLPEAAATTLTRVRVGANIAGEGTAHGSLLLAVAADMAATPWPERQASADAREQQLQSWLRLLLAPEASAPLVGFVADHLPRAFPDLCPELCRRLATIDAQASRAWAERLGIEPSSATKLAAGQPVEGR
jgi:hypothetical protein